MKTLRLTILLGFLMLLVAGCKTIDFYGNGGFTMLAVNVSDEILQDCLIRDANGALRYFGYIGRKGENNRKLEGVMIKLKNDLPLIWFANGSRDSGIVNLSRYEPSASRIKNLILTYHGRGRWTVAAADANNNVLRPAAPTSRKL